LTTICHGESSFVISSPRVRWGFGKTPTLKSSAEKVMSEERKSKISNYVVGALGGAAIVLIAGFSLGMLKTNGAVAEAVGEAVVEQQALFCAERARADVAYVDADTFSALERNQKRDFAAQFSTFDGQSTSDGRAVANACTTLLETA
jgi:hypothetical protein